MGKTENTSFHIIGSTYITFVVLICMWIFAWIIKNYLDLYINWLTTDAGSFIYWMFAKVFIWILPALWLIRLSGRSLREVFNFSNWKGWLIWGGGIGCFIAFINYIPTILQGSSLLPAQAGFSLLNILFIAPAFEELLMRGAILYNLQQKHSFLTANLLSSLMFVILHIPGWYFAGDLEKNLTTPVGGALSIFLLGLAFGYAAYRSRSVMGGMLAHFLNNLS